MPLVTENIFEARALYSALEVRAVSAEQNVAVLRDTVSSFAAVHQNLAEKTSLMGEFVASQAAANSQLLANQATQVSPDLPLDAFIASMGLAVALGEASMPDRAISAMQVTAQGYLSLGPAADGSRTVGFRLHQPELGNATALATATFEIAKVIGPAGAPAPRNLYAVLQETQAVFSDPFWAQFSTGAPPSRPAAQVVVDVAKMLAGVADWTAPYLVHGVAAIAESETALAGAIGGAAPAERVAAFTTMATALGALAKQLDPAVHPAFVAGDVYALTAALDATTRIAASLRA